jgi:sporulation-control protein spo0M
MKISKCTSLFLACLILVSNVGLAFNVHYCGGKIAAVTSVYGVTNAIDVESVPVKKSCCGATENEDKSCCDNKVIKVKEKSDGFIKTFSFHIDFSFTLQNWKSIAFEPVSENISIQTRNYYCDAHAPPLYRLYSQLLFYA